jgi:hypothetical protein
MADRSALRLVGLIFGGVTVAVMVMAGAVVYANVGARPPLDQGHAVSAATATRGVR